MSDVLDRELLWLAAGVLGVLVISSIVGAVLARRVTSDAGRATVANLNARIRSWWVMSAVFALALLTRGLGSVLLFAVISFFALREFITLVPTRHGDHRTLLWVFFVVMPIQYWLVWNDWYGLFAIFIPVYVFLLVPTRSASRLPSPYPATPPASNFSAGRALTWDGRISIILWDRVSRRWTRRCFSTTCWYPGSEFFSWGTWTYATTWVRPPSPWRIVGTRS